MSAYEYMMGIGTEDSSQQSPVTEAQAQALRKSAEQKVILATSLANAGIAALIAKSGDRKVAALVGVIAAYVGFQTGIASKIGMALCPFEGEGAISCVFPILGLPGIATGIGFRIAAKRSEEKLEQASEVEL